MPKTLIGSKSKLEKDLNDAFNNAAKEAYMTQFKSNNVAEAGRHDAAAKSKYEKQAKEYAQTLADELAGKMAQAIYDFVKEIGIQVTIPSSVVAPSGPCWGTIPMNNFKII